MTDHPPITTGQCFPALPRKSQVSVTPDRRIAVYIGSAYQYLDVYQALTLRKQLKEAVAKALGKEQAS